jgi:hypothetical protein
MNKLQLTLAAVAAAGTLSLSTMAPASADSAASTRNIILGAAALAGIAIEANVAHKNAQANAVSGYLPDGSTVYGDGHVVGRNGDSYYPGNTGQTVSCNNSRCNVAYTNGNGNGYNGSPYNANVFNGTRYTGNAYNGAPANRYAVDRANGNTRANAANGNRGTDHDRDDR